MKMNGNYFKDEDLSTGGSSAVISDFIADLVKLQEFQEESNKNKDSVVGLI